MATYGIPKRVFKKTLIFYGDEIMSVYELSKNQLIELKQNYLCEVQKNVSYGGIVRRRQYHK